VGGAVAMSIVGSSLNLVNEQMKMVAVLLDPHWGSTTPVFVHFSSMLK